MTGLALLGSLPGHLGAMPAAIVGHLLAASQAVDSAVRATQIGTAQDLTFGIFFGAFSALGLLSLFVFRSGHERAHRLQVLREQRRQELDHQRPAQLEATHRRPHLEEGGPQ